MVRTFQTFIIVISMVFFGFISDSHAESTTGGRLGGGIAATTIGGLGTLAGLGIGIAALTFLPCRDSAAMVGFPGLLILALSTPLLIAGILLLVKAVGIRNAAPDVTSVERLELSPHESLPMGYVWRF